MAKKRRQHGTGSVYQRSVDGRWMGTIQAGYSRSGARRRIVVSAKTEAECKRKLRDKRLAIDRDGLSDNNRRVSVKQWSDEWLSIVSHTLRPKTYAGYVSAVGRWVVPAIGAKALNALTPGDVRKVGNTQREAGLSSSTVLHTHAVLVKMLRAAQLEGHAIPARVLVVERPVPAANDREGMALPEAVAVLEVAFELPHFSRWAAALLQGMRQGECLGLTWDNVDLRAGTIAVSWQLQALPYADREAETFLIPDGYEVRRLRGAQHLVRPKTKKGWRVIPLVAAMLPVLAGWQATAPESPHGLVWPNLAGQPANVKDDLAEWKGLQGTAGVGHPAGRYYVLHEARNTTATLLMEARASNEVITAILGHSSIVTSRSYMHVEQSVAREAMERVASRLLLPVR